MIGRVGQAVARELARFGVAPGLTRLVDGWPAAVGPEIARNAWPARLARDGTLHVHTSSSAWAFELGHLEERMRAALGELAPTRMRFVVGPLPEPPKDVGTDARRVPLRPTPEHVAKAESLTRGICDADLRKVVAKAAAASLAAQESGRSFW